MRTIKIKSEKVPHYEGFSLYIKGHKVHLGVFVNLTALREFWNKYRVLLCSGYCFKNDKCEKIN